MNGNKVLKRTVRETEQEYKHTIAEEKHDRRNEMKARGTLLMALPNKDQLKFHSYKDAKLLMEAIEKSQLEIQGKVISQEDMNLKMLRSLSSEWKTHALIWRNKVETETISLDDFTNSNSNNSTNEADKTTYGVSATHTQSNPTSGDNLSDAEITMLTIRARRIIKRADMKAPRNQENRGRENSRRTMTVETPTENAFFAQDGIGGYDWSYKAEEEHPTNYALMAYTSSESSSSSDSEVDTCLESVEARLAHYKKNEAVYEESINVLNLEVKLRDNALVENKKKLEKAEKERDELKLTLEKFQDSSKSLNNLLEIESFVNSSEMLENKEYNKSKYDKGYHAVPPPYTGNFIPFKHDLTFMDEIVESENIDVTPSNVKTVESNHEFTDVKSNGDAVEPKTMLFSHASVCVSHLYV
ncbi:hypothetical protein Tco_0024537 [Tanacetum coccineum]